jgi:tetratricopeptide (TPR) repeat protein
MSEKPDSQNEPKAGDTIVARIGDKVQNVVVGKNIIQIGSLSIPNWLVILVAASMVAGIGLISFLVYQDVHANRRQATLQQLLTPTATPMPRMTGQFNVFVAEFGEIDESGQVQTDDHGYTLSVAIYETLRRVYDELTVANSDLGRLEIWHDRLRYTAVGVISGETPAERKAAAEEKAQSIGADMLIYGYRVKQEDEEHLQYNFYFRSPALQEVANPETPWNAPELIGGTYPFGEPIPVGIGFDIDATQAKRLVEGPLSVRSEALFWITVGLSYSITDQSEDALRIFRQVEEQAPDWQDRDGKWILYYLWGKEALTLRHYEEAITAFERAIDVNPNSVAAQVGLGGVYLDRAETFFGRGRDLPAEAEQCREAQNSEAGAATLAESMQDAERALTYFQKAQDLLAPSNDVLLQSLVEQSLGLIYRQQGQTQIFVAYEQLVAAEPFGAALDAGEEMLSRAVDTFEQTLGPFEEGERYSELALSHWGVGNSRRLLAHIHLVQAAVTEENVAGDVEEQEKAIELLESAVDSYDACIAQRTRLPADLLLKTRIIECACKPGKSEAEAVLATQTLTLQPEANNP